MSTTPTSKRKHIKHNTLDRVRHGAFNAFLAAQATAKSVTERLVRDAMRTISNVGQTAAQIKAAADVAHMPGITTNTITATIAQKAVVSPTNLSFGLYVPPRQSRNLQFGATSGSITVDFAISGGTITRASGSFVDDGFQIGSILTLAGCADAGNNSSHPVVTDVQALVLTCDTIAADETADAGVTITCTNTIFDTDAVSLATILSAADPFSVSGTSLNDDQDFQVSTVSGAVILLDTDAGDAAVIEATVDSYLKAKAGTIDYGYGVSDLVDFSRYAGTITFDSEDPTDGFVVGGLIDVKGTVKNNGRYQIIAVDSSTITVARATTGSITVTFTLGRKGKAHRSSGSFITDGFQYGDYVSIGAGAADATNRSVFKVIGVTASDLFLADLPASETNDSGVVISTVHFTDELACATATINQVNSISGIDTTDLAAGMRFSLPANADEGYANPVTGDYPTDVLTVATVVDGTVMLVTGYEFAEPLNNRSALQWIFVTNRILRAAGNNATDGFVVGERITVADAVTGVDGVYTVKSVGTTVMQVNEDFGSQVVKDTNATIKGRGKITRGAGSWATDGFALGREFYMTGTVDALNDGYHRIAKVVSTTVLELESYSMTAETSTASVKVYLISEKAR